MKIQNVHRMKTLSQSLATYLRRWRVQKNQAMTVLMKTMNRGQKLLIGLVAMAHIGDQIPFIHVKTRAIIVSMNSQAQNAQ